MTHPLSTLTTPVARPPRFAPADVSYVVEDTAVGRMLLAVTAEGTLVTCTYTADDEAEARWLQRLADEVSPRVLRHPGPTDDARRALEAFLAGRATTVDVATDLVLARPFQREVLGALRERVAYGERTTYGELAAASGHPGASRAVGTALGGNPLCVVVPCHRVVPASGGVGGYAGGPAAKEHLLALESSRAGDGSRA